MLRKMTVIAWFTCRGTALLKLVGRPSLYYRRLDWFLCVLTSIPRRAYNKTKLKPKKLHFTVYENTYKG